MGAPPDAMTFIAKNDPCALLWRGVFDQLDGHLRHRGAQAARTVVLVPYAQLMSAAARYWALWRPDGFVPRFETTRNWAAQLGAYLPEGTELAMDAGRDALTARTLLEQAGLGEHKEVLAGALQEAAAQLAGVVAALPPGQRGEWAQQARTLLPPMDAHSPLHLEAAVARIALEWATASRYPSDVLFESGVRDAVDALVVLEGFQTDALPAALVRHWGERACVLPLAAVPVGAPEEEAPPAIRLHAARDTEDEALRAAACVVAHCNAGRVPVALVATDRALTRRVRAHLDTLQLPVRDESGWILSTTRAAASVMACVRASAWNAESDLVLDWLKQVPVLGAAKVAALEKWMRRQGYAQWSAMAQVPLEDKPELAALMAQVQSWRDTLRAPRPLAQWLQALRELLQATGQWGPLQIDEAGTRVLAALRLADGLQVEVAEWAAAERRMGANDFARWADEVLEAGRYVGKQEADAPVVILPLAQALARPFAAWVLPGCDEKRLQTSPEPPGAWTAAQREAWGLPTRTLLEQALRKAWAHALRGRAVDVLWRTGDEGGEPLLPSPLVQALHGAPGVSDGAEGAGAASGQAAALLQRELPATPTRPPQPRGQALPVQRLSSSAYEDLRRCPYRFFALRQLGLQEADEMGAELDKRDYGTWLHAVLQQFHEGLRDAMVNPADEPTAALRARLDAAAQATLQAQGLQGGDFLPFEAGWPQVREGYLHWLAAHTATGAGFSQAEVRAEQPLAPVQLVGVIDRVDVLAPSAGGGRLLIDYKTESDAATAKRTRAGTEDTQLAFYAALVGGDDVQAAYVNVGERGETRTHAQADVQALRDALCAGIQADMRRIAEGVPLPALGEGAVCDYCAARGLCRKDFWNV